MKYYFEKVMALVVFGLTLVGNLACDSGGDNPSAPATVQRTGGQNDCVVASDTILGYTNYERCLQGIAPLVENSRLDTAAQCHSEDMFQRHYVAHDAPEPAPCGGTDAGQRISATGYSWNTCGENIASGLSSARSVVAAWMGSPTHRPNILNPDFKELGVGQSGRVWTQVFASR